MQTSKWLLWPALSLSLLLLSQLPRIQAGFACLSNPCSFGICIDDVNSTFSCYCIDGYTGVLCQTNWDECWSNPCLNNGLCQDGIAAFNCTCNAGFQGDLCEVNINECESNPCHNNGTCVDGEDGYTCACLPGYSGPYCEHDISVCNATEETRCENGGLCIEGPGVQFNCICQQGWTGALCEMAVDECASSPCRNGAVCLDHHANYSCACPFGYSGRNCEVVLEMCGTNDPCENGALCLIEDWTSVCYCVPDYHGDRCQFQYDECLLGPGCKNGGTCVDGVDEFSCSCPSDLTGDSCECLILDEDNMDCSYVAPTAATKPTTVQAQVTTNTPVTPIHVPTTEKLTSIHIIDAEATTDDEMMTLSEETTFVSFPTTAPTQSTEGTEMTSGNPPEEIDDFTTDVYAISQHFTTADDNYRTNTEKQIFIHGKTSSFSPVDETTASSYHLFTTQQPFTTHPLTTQESIYTSTSSEFHHTIGNTTDLPVLQTTSELIFPPEIPSSTDATEFPLSCRKLPCLNGGLCLNTTDGLKCVCKAGWEGVQCEGRSTVKVAAFSGQSYVAHQAGNSSHARVDITARTVGMAGLILFSNLSPGIYMALYLESGLLKFKFSCGLQTMLLSEVQFHINNGYDLLATVTLDFLPGARGSQHCLATVRVNNTLAMSGEQIAAEPPDDPKVAALYLGGIPPSLDLDLPVLEGFVGCMQNLVVDEQPRNILGDAMQSFDIKECLSLACLSNPCQNGAACVDKDNEWSCQCPSGFLGVQCEKSVCDNSPCEYGGTCVGFPGSGFICLCPLGKHGQFCEYDLDIGHPVYSSSVGGLSSFSAHILPTEIHQSMILSFKFIPHDMEQISLMAFLGQDGPHGHESDHLAVSFIKGYVVLTWNLGSGPRRIFTGRPIEDFGHRPHFVQIGREGQRSWLVVDNLGNVTGKSPGPLSELNTRSVLYLGGHDSGNFSLLPHDLPLHTGFSGCLFDVRLQTGHMMMMVQHTRATTGRSVGQCGTSLCHEHACQHGAGCIHHGATFTCLCADSWFGPTCGFKFNPCDHTRHNCSNGATCVPGTDGYSCDCPLGKSGPFCDQDEMLSDVRFSGRRSYLVVAAEGLHQHRSCIEMEVKPSVNQGLLLYSGRSDQHQYLSLSLQGGVLELRVSPGRHRRRGEPLVIRSRRLMALDKWHRVRVARYGRKLFLWVEGTVNSALLLPGETLPASNTLLYIGGVPDLSTLPPGATAAYVTAFKGCVRRLTSQWRRVPLNNATILAGRNIADCDGTTCGGDICHHGGSCFLDHHKHPKCTCTNEYSGDYCETQASCVKIGCKNGGRCLEDKTSAHCSCPLGKGGPFCEEDTGAESPSFGGDSYIMIDRMPQPNQQSNALVTTNVDFVYLNFTTTHTDGLLFWTARPGAHEFLGVGLQDGHLKVVWAWDGQEAVAVTVPGGGVADGTWHDVAVSLQVGNVSIWTDHRQVLPPPSPAPPRSLATDGRFYLGGLPPNTSLQQATNGHFGTEFRGCLQKLAWSIESVISNFSGYQGENIDVCDPFKP